MGNVTLNTKEEKDFTVVSFEIDGVLDPQDLATLVPPKVIGTKGVIINGRGPIWLYCFLTHFYHPTRFVATYDPRLGGAVIVESHFAEYQTGSIIECCLSETIV